MTEGTPRKPPRKRTRKSTTRKQATTTPEDRRRGRTRTLETREMAGRLRRGAIHRYELPLVDAVHFEPREVPLDPYALGLLLGDGCLTTSTTPAFATAGRFLRCPSSSTAQWRWMRPAFMRSAGWPTRATRSA